MSRKYLAISMVVLLAAHTACKNRLSSMAYASDSAAPNSDVAAFLLEPLPPWARDTIYSGSYLDIDKVTTAFGFSRYEAIELQNRMRDFQDATPSMLLQESFDKALDETKNHKFESGWTPKTFAKPEEFVAVFDMDETLLVQWHSSANQGFSDLFHVIQDVVGSKISPDSVKFTPGAEAVIMRLKANPACVGVVAFSAKADTPMIDILDKWKFSDGEPARKHLSGVFTRNHLILGPKVWTPSKDLRIFDPELKHVVMIDDNPARIFQPLLLRAEPKFDADTYQKAKASNNAAITTHYESILRQAGDEIEEASHAAASLQIPFSQAFIPYSLAGSRIFRAFVASGKSKDEALSLTRAAPELNDAAFAPVAQ